MRTFAQLPQRGLLIWLLASTFELFLRSMQFVLLVVPGGVAFLRFVLRWSISEVGGMRDSFGPLTWWGANLMHWRKLRMTAASSTLRVDGAPCAFWYDLRHADEAPLVPPLLLIYVHGGGFCSHTATEPLFAAPMLERLAARGVHARVLALDYTLAPGEEGRSRQLRQLLHAYNRVASMAHKETKLVLAGDSAGGHLVVAIVRALLAETPDGHPRTRLPDALVAISPWAEVALPQTSRGVHIQHSPSRTRNSRRGTDYVSLHLLERLALRAGHARDYLLPAKEEEELIPSRDASGAPLLPPTVIFIGGGELLVEDGRKLSATLSLLCPGYPNRVRLVEEPDAPHDWPLLPWFDLRRGTAARGMDQLAEFVLVSTGLADVPSHQLL